MKRSGHRSVVGRCAGVLILLWQFAGPALALGLQDQGIRVVHLLWQWFVDPAHWSGENGLPYRIAQHAYYVVASMLLATAIALPVGIGLGHFGRGGLIVINVSNIGRAVPSF